ncbi:MAG: DUF547 domain-containing protein [Gammaproteobacteria bacterium]|nr:DUF547 domain-containing protein [Gammaproteobacteria bacterium]
MIRLLHVLGMLALLGTHSMTFADDAAMRERFAPFQTLLERHLEERDLEHDGLVTAFDYGAALSQADSSNLLAEQRRLLAGFDAKQISERAEAIAFWLNAYNFFMIAHILENPRRGELIRSVRDYGNLFNPYRVFRQAMFDVGGQRYSLDDMEKSILLGDEFRERGWKDARVHFAVNCASVGCPPLRKTIYLAGTLDAVLTENTRRALNTSRHLRLEGATLHLTRLFDWYASDYEEEAGSINDYLLQYADDRVREQIKRSERIRFIDYDWTLNAPENFPEFE